MKAKVELGKIREYIVSILLKRAKEGLSICDKDYECFEKGFPFLGRKIQE